ncbi:MAG TPA: OFA family MFS transporter [Anaeromyxobacteraceae bacterium]
MAELDPLNARVLAFVLKRLPAAATGDVCWFAVPGAGGAHPAAICPLRPAGLGSAVFTLGHGSRIYATVTDADPRVIGAILARLEAEGFGGGAAEAAGRFDDAAMREAGRVGVALLPSSASRFHAGLGDRVRVDDRVFPISMVHFLDEEEMAWAEQHGVGLLRERFLACGRNLLRFASSQGGATATRHPEPTEADRVRAPRAARGAGPFSTRRLTERLGVTLDRGASMARRGWLVVLGGMGLNLALGILYAWSVFSKQLVEAVDKGGFGWTKMQATLPYTVAIAFFAIMMIPAGLIQDRVGPRVVASAGGILSGLGLLVASFAGPGAVLPAVLGFGVLGGSGFGLGYAAATPAAVKWFPPEKKGLITGLVVAGFGVAPVYIAPLSKYLLGAYGTAASFRILGFGFLVAATAFAQLVRNPAAPVLPKKDAVASALASARPELTWRDMIRTPAFWSLWLRYACAATAGLMIIGHMAKIVAVQSGNTVKIGFVFVALLACFNAAGRVVAGVVSDYVGRVVTIGLVCVFQALAMFLFSNFTSIGGFVVGAAVVGFSYGACLSLFPATVADTWGTKNLGLNYGILFTAWGVGGVFGPMLAGWIADRTGSYANAYDVAGALLAFSFILTALSYIEVSVKIPDREITVRLGKRTDSEAA